MTEQASHSLLDVLNPTRDFQLTDEVAVRYREIGLFNAEQALRAGIKTAEPAISPGDLDSRVELALTKGEGIPRQAISGIIAAGLNLDGQVVSSEDVEAFFTARHSEKCMELALLIMGSDPAALAGEKKKVRARAKKRRRPKR